MRADVGLVRPLVRQQQQQQQPAGSRKAAAWSSTAAAATVNQQQGQLAPPTHLLTQPSSIYNPTLSPILDESLPWRDVPSGPLWESRGTLCWLSPLVPSGRPPAGSWSRKGGSTPAPPVEVEPASGASRGRTTPASSSYFLPQHFSPH